jgi:hypothetical protein
MQMLLFNSCNYVTKKFPIRWSPSQKPKLWPNLEYENWPQCAIHDLDVSNKASNNCCTSTMGAHYRYPTIVTPTLGNQHNNKHSQYYNM